MYIDVNVHIDVTERAQELIEHLIGAVVLAKSGLTAEQVADKVDEEVKKGVAAGVLKTTPAAKEDKPANLAPENAGKPAKVTVEKPVKIVIEKTAEPEEDPNAKVKGEKLVALREVVGAVIKANGENRKKLKDWLTEHGLKKVPDCTFAQADELMEFMDGLGGGEDNA